MLFPPETPVEILVERVMEKIWQWVAWYYLVWFICYDVFIISVVCCYWKKRITNLQVWKYWHHLFVFDMLITSLSLWFNFKCMIVFALILSLSLFRFCQTYKVAKTVSSHQIIWPIWFIELQTLSFTVAIGNMRHFPESLSVKKSLAKFGTRFCRDVKINHNFLKVNLHQVVNVEVSNFFHACTCPVDVWHEFAMENVNNYNVGTLFTFHQIAVLKNQSECFEDLLPGKLNLTIKRKRKISVKKLESHRFYHQVKMMNLCTYKNFVSE